MLIDTHCHLNFKAFDKDLPEVINRAKKAGVNKIIIPGAKTDSSEKAVEIANKYDCCYAAIGIHPHHTEEYIRMGKNDVTRKLIALIHSNVVKAVGEIGLDYHVYKEYPGVTEKIKKAQKELFIAQLDIAQKHNLPVIIHSRNSMNDVIDILTEFVKSVKTLKGVFHCFSGNRTHLKRILDMGFFAGFDGNITYPENEDLRLTVSATPADRILLETDSPYLTPVPHRNTRNEPHLLPLIAGCIASIKKSDPEKIGTATSRNAMKLFSV